MLVCSFTFSLLFVSDPPQIGDVDSRGRILIVLMVACEAVSVNKISDGMSERAFFFLAFLFSSCKSATSDSASMKSGVMHRYI